MKINSYAGIDLFAGCGGLSEGFTQQKATNSTEPNTFMLAGKWRNDRYISCTHTVLQKLILICRLTNVNTKAISYIDKN
jgi:hypothetical protein